MNTDRSSVFIRVHLWFHFFFFGYSIRIMKDPRFTDLAKLLVAHSTKIQRGEKVLIEAFDIPPDFTVELIRTIAAAGGVPLVSTYNQLVQRALFQAASEEQMKLWS